MALIEDITKSISEGFKNGMYEITNTINAYLHEFLRGLMADVCDIGCVIVVAYSVVIAVKLMITNDKKTRETAFDKTLINMTLYSILRLAGKLYVVAGNGAW